MQTWKFIQGKVKGSVPVILLYVLESKGSSPGRQGFVMAVAADNSMKGSIGGGIMEHKFVEMARAVLQQGRVGGGVYRQVHDKKAAMQSGMICSGEQTIFLYEVQPQDSPAIDALVRSLEHFQNGSLRLSPAGIAFYENAPTENFQFVQKGETDFELIEKTGFKNRLHIVGGGHCALALSRLMSRLDFHISLYEERDDLNTLQENFFVQHICMLDSYAALQDKIAAGNNVYVVIMTFGYRTDDVALRALLGKDFKYLGVMGSQRKMEKMFEAYRQEGVDEHYLQKICSPIGLPIRSQTPDEIAISIAAQIIAVKNGS